MSTEILVTKLHTPAARQGLVVRPRLVERLQEGLEGHRVTLVSAPAGFGKTTLVTEWLQGMDRPVAWLSLDEEDDALPRFFTYLAAALQGIESDIGAAVRDAVQAPELPPSESLVTALINDVVERAPAFVLVLDDYHLVKGSVAVHEAMAFLIDHLPPQMHLVVATREDPPLPLPRLRGRGEVTELRAGDLRFTEEEATALLVQAMGLDLQPEDVAVLEARTEGWVAGLQLAALALRKVSESEGRAGCAEFVRGFSGDDRHVMDYLVEEVLVRQPEEVRRFLSYTSILDRLSGPLCDAVLGEEGPSGSQGMLEELERMNLFVVPLDNRREWYRYHGLFASLLRRWLQGEIGEEGAAHLHLRASAWYEQEGLADEALAHALAAQEFERAVSIIKQHGDGLLLRGETATLLRWLESLPEEVVHASPVLCIYGALIFSTDFFQVRTAERWLECAERAFAALARRSPEAEREIRDWMAKAGAMVRARLALLHRDPQAVIPLSSQALDLIDDDAWSDRAEMSSILAQAHLYLGDEAAADFAFEDAMHAALQSGNRSAILAAIERQLRFARRQGRLHRAAALCREGLEGIAKPAEVTRQLPSAGQLYIYLAGVMLEWNDLDEAERLLAEGMVRLELVAQHGYAWSVGYRELGRLKRARGNVDEALCVIDRVEKYYPEADSYSYAASLRVRLWLAQSHGDPSLLEHAERWAREIEPYLDFDEGGVHVPLDPWRHARHLAMVRFHVARRRAIEQGDLRPDLDLLEAQLDANRGVGWNGRVIELLAIKALALDALGEVEQALDALQQALELGEPEGFVRLFLDEGPPMEQLLQQIAARGTGAGYVARLLAVFQGDEAVPAAPASSPGVPCGLVESLSKREIEVLALLAEGRSNREIAQALVVALSTVKRHLSNLYGKLGVRSRTGAVVRAREMGIVLKSQG